MSSVSQVSMMEEQQRQNTMVSLLAPRLTRLTNLLSGWRQEAAADPPKPLSLNVCACPCQEESQRPLVAVVHALTSQLGSMFSFLQHVAENPLASVHDHASVSVEVLLPCVSTRGPPGARENTAAGRTVVSAPLNTFSSTSSR